MRTGASYVEHTDSLQRWLRRNFEVRRMRDPAAAEKAGEAIRVPREMRERKATRVINR